MKQGKSKTLCAGYGRLVVVYFWNTLAMSVRSIGVKHELIEIFTSRILLVYYLKLPSAASAILNLSEGRQFI